MEHKVARAIKAVWGDKPCNHPHIESERINGVQTGDWVCTTCGEDFTKAERDQILADRESKD